MSNFTQDQDLTIDVNRTSCSQAQFDVVRAATEVALDEYRSKIEWRYTPNSLLHNTTQSASHYYISAEALAGTDVEQLAVLHVVAARVEWLLSYFQGSWPIDFTTDVTAK